MWRTCKRACVPAWFTTNMSARANGPKAYKAIIFTWQYDNKCAYGKVPIFQTLLLRNASRNFYTSLSKEKYYIILDFIVIHISIWYVEYKNKIRLYFYASYHIKEECVELFVFNIFSVLFLRLTGVDFGISKFRKFLSAGFTFYF